MLRNKPLKHSQQGQGMVEYAIMLILLITLVVGGIELAGATLASGKASDAAKAGVNDFATVNEKRLKAQENQQKYLRQLEILLHQSTTSEYETLVDSGMTEEDVLGYVAYPSTQKFISYLDSTSSAYADYAFDNYVKFLDYYSRREIAEGGMSWQAYLPFFDEDDPAYKKLITFTSTTYSDEPEPTYTALAEILLTVDGILDPNGDGVVDESDQDDDITIEELRCAVDTSCEFNILNQIKNLDPVGDADDDSLTSPVYYQAARYKALLLLEEIQLSLLPLDPRADLSESIPLLGDHDPNTNNGLVRPSCDAGAGTYDYGFPTYDDDELSNIRITTVSEFTNSDGVDVAEAEYPAVYLFNPLPIQLDSCVGKDSDRGNQSRISILVGGYGDEWETNYEPGLPKLNTSFYGQYQRVCLNAANEYVGCGRAGVAEEILKPPGKTCFSDVASNTIDSCIADDPPNQTSGYYFWGEVNDQGNGKFSWSNDDNPNFRPTMQLTCNGESHQSPKLINDSCLDDTDDPDAVANLKTIQVNVRYRHVFESFLTFGMMELDTTNDPNLAQYFYDPSNLRSPTVTAGVAIAGSELGPKAEYNPRTGRGGTPTVKQFKDFRGCYEINVETNQTTSCN